MQFCDVQCWSGMKFNWSLIGTLLTIVKPKLLIHLLTSQWSWSGATSSLNSSMATTNYSTKNKSVSKQEYNWVMSVDLLWGHTLIHIINMFTHKLHKCSLTIGRSKYLMAGHQNPPVVTKQLLVEMAFYFCLSFIFYFDLFLFVNFKWKVPRVQHVM